MPPNPTIDGDDAAEDIDDAPTFLDQGEAVEVKGLDDAAPMDESDEPAEQSGAPLAVGHAPQQAIPDDSTASFVTHTDAVYAVDSHYDAATGTLYVASGGGDDRAYLHALSNSGGTRATRSAPLGHPHTDSVSCVSFNAPYVNDDASGAPQRSLLAAGSYDGSIVLYDPSDGRLVRAMEGPEDVEWLSFHPRGGTVLLAGSMADGTVWMYHLPTDACLQVFVGHEGGVVAGGFTPDGKTVVSAGADGTVRVWAPRKGTCKHVFRLMGRGHGGGEMQPGLTCLALGGGQDGQLAAAGGEDGNAYVVHISGKKLVATLPHFEEGKQQQQQAAASAGGNEDDMDDDNMDGEGEARSVEAVGFCPPAVPGSGGWCATGGSDGVLKVWNTAVASGGSAQMRQRCVRPAPDGGGRAAGVTRLRWHDSLPLVVCSYSDGALGVWDARDGRCVRSFGGNQDVVNDMAVSFVPGGDAAVVVTGSDDRSVRVFELHP